MKEAALILIATFAFAGVAFNADWPRSEPQCPEVAEVVRHVYVPTPQPIYPAPKLLPVDEIGPPVIEKPAAAEEDKEDQMERPAHQSQRRHYRRHYRRHR